MSDSTNLRINITATEAEATAAVKRLQAEVRGLQAAYNELAAYTRAQSAASVSSVQTELNARRRVINAIHEEISAYTQLTAAGRAAARANAEAENRNVDAVNRSMQARIRAHNTASYAAQQAEDRAAEAAEKSAARAAAAKEQQIRQSIAANNARVYAERAAEDAAAATAYSTMRREAAEENALFDKRLKQKETDARVAETNMRRRADLDNAEFDRVAKARAQSAEGIIARQGPGLAAGAAASAAVMRGGTPLDVHIASVQAETAAIAKQQAALQAVQAARVAAARAGASAAEIEMAATKAATAAMAGHATAINAVKAAASGGVSGTWIERLGAIFQREMRHVVGFFDSIARGQRGAALSSLGAAARDSGAGIGVMAASMGALIAVMGVEAIIKHAEALGKWASSARAAASAAGMSINQYTQLQGAMRLSGHSAEEADATLRHLAGTVNTALTNSSSDAAQAFRNLGISEQQLKDTGGDLSKVLSLVADAYKNTSDSVSKAANMEEIFGRSLEKIIPLLEGGSSALDAHKKKAEELGITLTDKTAKALEETAQKAEELSLKISGEMTQAFVNAGPTIEGLIAFIGQLASAISGLIGLIGKLDDAILSIPKIPYLDAGIQFLLQGGPNQAGLWLHRKIFGDSAGTTPAGPSTPPDRREDKRAVPPLVKGGDETLPQKIEEAVRLAGLKAGETALAAHQNKKAVREAETKAEIAELQKSLTAEGLTDRQIGALRRELYEKKMSLVNQEAASGGAGKHNKQDAADFIAAERLKIAEADGNSKKIAAIYDEEIAGLKRLEAQHKATAAQISNAERAKVEAVNKARLEEIKSGAKLEEQQTRLLMLTSQLAAMAGGTFKYAGQKEGPGAEEARSAQYVQEAAQVEASAQRQIAELRQVMATSEEGTTNYKKAQDEILAITIDAKAKEVDLYKKAGDAAVAAANKMTAPFLKAFDQIGSELEKFGNDLLDAFLKPEREVIKAGLSSRTISHQGDQIKAAVGSLFLDIGKTIAKSLGEALTKSLANALSGGAANTIGELLTGLFKKGITSLFGSTAGEALGKVAGGAAGSLAGGAGGAAALGTAGATLNTAGATLNTAGAALNAAAATLSTAGAAGGIGGAAGGVAGSATTDAAIAALGTTLVGAITASTTAISGAITAGDATIVAAITVGHPSVAGFSLAGGGIIPSAQGGMITGGLGGGRMAILHPREMVLPEHISTGLQNMISGRGGAANSNTANLNYSPTINTGPRGRGGTGMSRSEFSQMMSVHGGAMLGEARNAMRAGWRA